MERGVSVEGNFEFKPTLCWNCAKATNQEACPWVRDFTPVPGWTAEPTHHEGFYAYDSYRVIKCPLFARDACRGGLIKASKAVMGCE